ncbi:hypothetical protein U9M48_024864 [Paspalum notatum var. saurae]|uniref:Uncharacterized protein n=1 Tax=Paspalum notatum var. saurae TaxID=547442 RepID=A0AAQ3TSA0_PASNO
MRRVGHWAAVRVTGSSLGELGGMEARRAQGKDRFLGAIRDDMLDSPVTCESSPSSTLSSSSDQGTAEVSELNGERGGREAPAGGGVLFSELDLVDMSISSRGLKQVPKAEIS